LPLFLIRSIYKHLTSLDACKSIEQQVFNDISKLDLNRRYRYLAVKQGIRIETEWPEWCAEAIECERKIKINLANFSGIEIDRIVSISRKN
jgi:hypothetical protein